MIIVNCKQNTPEWDQEKLGKPSASNCSKIITSTGSVSKSRNGYLYELAGELITGKRSEGYTNANMEEGHTREEEGRSYFEMVKGVKIEQVGVIYKNKDKKFLCSPDGTINKTEGFEQKNPLPKTQVKYLIDNKLPTDYFGQVQFSLYVTGFKIWNFLSHVPGMPPLLIRVERDEGFIRVLEIELNVFCAELRNIVDKIK